jgi:2-dehydro-3-deoxygalactonokinase
LIAVDWGSSNFRAFRITDAGEIVEKRSSTEGALSILNGQFAEVLMAQVGDWIAAGEDRVLMCGMVGSRQGWIEAAYLSCPAGLEELAGSLIKVPMDCAHVYLVPGVTGIDSYGVPEVMRGEETEAMGVLDACNGTGLVCMPGTHSKWIHLDDDKIVNFLTYMTGDVFAALASGTILSRIMTMDSAMDSGAFLKGVERSADSGGLLHHLFSVRTLGLMGRLKEEAAASYLSGLLIGHEVRSAMPPNARVHLVGNPELCSLYTQAITACGGSCTVENKDAAARGLAAISKRSTWI